MKLGVGHGTVADAFMRSAAARPDAVTKLRHEVVDYALGLGATPQISDAIKLAVSEALTNVVCHAYVGREQGVMAVAAWRDGNGHLVVRISDDGHGLVPRVESPRRGLGVGLALMAEMADDFRIGNREGTPGTIVSLRFALTDKESAATLVGGHLECPDVRARERRRCALDASA